MKFAWIVAIKNLSTTSSKVFFYSFSPALAIFDDNLSVLIPTSFVYGSKGLLCEVLSNRHHGPQNWGQFYFGFLQWSHDLNLSLSLFWPHLWRSLHKWTSRRWYSLHWQQRMVESKHISVPRPFQFGYIIEWLLHFDICSKENSWKGTETPHFIGRGIFSSLDWVDRKTSRLHSYHQTAQESIS